MGTPPLVVAIDELRAIGEALRNEKAELIGFATQIVTKVAQVALFLVAAVHGVDTIQCGGSQQTKIASRLCAC